MKTKRTKIQEPAVQFDDESEDQDVAEDLAPGTTAAVVTGTDWTTETIVSQLRRGNIQLNPRFQRRDAWKRDRKSRFIESLIVGLPIPQIVLAESKEERGRFLVLDGKQRLLSILQYWGDGEGDNNAYALSSLTLRGDLNKVTFRQLATEPRRQSDYNALANQTIRTVVIRNWRDSDFLHTVFLRLNTGSVSLSPQELRQALLPGEFSNYVDDAAVQSGALQTMLGLSGPDPRFRKSGMTRRLVSRSASISSISFERRLSRPSSGASLRAISSSLALRQSNGTPNLNAFAGHWRSITKRSGTGGQVKRCWRSLTSGWVLRRLLPWCCAAC